ncbi:MAG: plasmid pRiA4b ORF-3 family protein [Pseudonocardiaceae bacterium]
MSPVSRGRKGRKNTKSLRRIAPREECDCPECSAEDFDPQRLIDDLITSAGDLIDSQDPLDAELVGAAFVSIGAGVGETFDEALVNGFIPQFEARASTEAIAMLLAVGSVTQGRVRQAASAAADRLVAAGVPQPRWAAELNEPVTLTESWRLVDAEETASMLTCLFRRAGRSHTVVMDVDHRDCDAAAEILLFPIDQLATALEMIQADGRDSDLEIRKEQLDPAELRWQVETALDARAVHDQDERELGTADPPGDEDELPDYRTLAVWLRARMSVLPASSKPPAPHGGPDGHRADAAPVYQLKVELRGAKPPIWRRLEVPADISLARLHAVIQVAFNWYDGHLHVFQTPYGEFGTPDAELGHRAETSVTLEQVAPDAQSKIRYTYDFGDGWEHDILVEKVLDRDAAASYPRCTGGRRAAPPEDCGGVWGYADLVDVLADPAHPEHAESLEWLGLDEAAQFDPADFDAKTVTEALAPLR